MSEQKQPQPVKKRKARLKRTLLQVDEKLQFRTTKCALHSLLLTKHQQKDSTFKGFLEKVIVAVNQIESLASLVVKHHIFKTLENLKPEDSLSFELNQSYFSKVFTYLTSKPRGEEKEYQESLCASVQHIIKHVNPTLVHPDICLTQILQYSAKHMQTNFRVHMQMHLERSFLHWTRNQIRGIMIPTEFENQRKYMKQYMENLENYRFYDTYNYYKTTIEDILTEVNSDDWEEKEDDEKKSSFPYNKCLQLMWNMRRESEVLELETKRSMKSISVLPQNQMKCGAIRLDTRVMIEFYRKFKTEDKTENKETEDKTEDKKKKKKEDKETDGKLKEEKKKKKEDTEQSIRELLLVENQRKVWNEIFNLDKLEKLRPHQHFNWSVVTDGIFVSVLFGKKVPKTQKTRKRPKTSATKKPKKPRKKPQNGVPKEILSELLIGNYSERSILDKFEDWTANIHWVSVDPGVRNLLSTWSIGTNTSPYNLGQREYRHNSGLNQNLVWTKKRYQSMTDVKKALTDNPYGKSVLAERMTKYLGVIRVFWNKIWQFQGNKKIRRMKFTQWIHQQRFTDKVLKKFEKKCKVKKSSTTTVLLFGSGGSSGFGKLKGGGVKGPVVRLRRLLAKRFAVIHVDEFRTSKCCWECGRVMHHPKLGKMHGVSYCTETDHHRMLNRDTDAARKIGYRFLEQLRGNQDLGHWSRSFEVERLNEGTCNVFSNLANQRFLLDLGDQGSNRNHCPRAVIQNDSHGLKQPSDRCR